VYSVSIIGNVEQCRAEAEISDGEGAVLAVVYETSDGWHTHILVEQLNQAATDFQTAVENAKESLSHYVNRRGENPPENATWGVFSLWLMVKDDGTAMGMDMKAAQSPD
jgi:predicted phosphoribosyltransferase